LISNSCVRVASPLVSKSRVPHETTGETYGIQLSTDGILRSLTYNFAATELLL